MIMTRGFLKIYSGCMNIQSDVALMGQRRSVLKGMTIGTILITSETINIDYFRKGENKFETEFDKDERKARENILICLHLKELYERNKNPIFKITTQTKKEKVKRDVTNMELPESLNIFIVHQVVFVYNLKKQRNFFESTLW